MIGGITSALGGLIGGFIGNNKAKKAEKAQRARALEAQAFVEKQLQIGTDRLQPNVDLGDIARQAYAFERGLGPAPMISNAGYQVAGKTFNSPEEAQAYLDQGLKAFNTGATVKEPLMDSFDDREYALDIAKMTPGTVDYQTTYQPDKGIAAAGFDPRGASVEMLDPSYYQGFEFSPDHQYLYDQGLDAVAARASATGGRNSGATQAALQKRGVDLANTFREQYLSSLGALSQQGQNAATNLLGAGANVGTQVSNILTGLGNVEAASQIAQGNQQAGAVASGFDLIGSIGGLAGGGAGGGVGGLNGIFGGAGGSQALGGLGGISGGL